MILFPTLDLIENTWGNYIIYSIFLSTYAVATAVTAMYKYCDMVSEGDSNPRSNFP
jgi:hypothetical protein